MKVINQWLGRGAEPEPKQGHGVVSCLVCKWLKFIHMICCLNLVSWIFLFVCFIIFSECLKLRSRTLRWSSLWLWTFTPALNLEACLPAAVNELSAGQKYLQLIHYSLSVSVYSNYSEEACSRIRTSCLVQEEPRGVLFTWLKGRYYKRIEEVKY